MALIFNDTLGTTMCSGMYTLQVYVGNSWTDIHTVAGTHTCTVYIDSIDNFIKLDTSILISGNTYPFRWIDSNAVSSNIRDLAVNGTITMTVGIGNDADGFPQIEVTPDVTGGTGTYELQLTTPAGTHTVPIDSALLSSHGVADTQNFTIPIPIPVRGSDYGYTFQVQFLDINSSLASPVLDITQPPLNTDPGKSLSLSLTSDGSNISLSGTATGCTGKYRLEIRNSSNDPFMDQDFTDVSNGAVAQTFSYATLGLTAGQLYDFLLFDTAQVVSNNIILTV